MDLLEVATKIANHIDNQTQEETEAMIVITAELNGITYAELWRAVSNRYGKLHYKPADVR